MSIKDQREILTREVAAGKLIRSAQGTIVLWVVMLLLGGLFLGLFSLAIGSDAHLAKTLCNVVLIAFSLFSLFRIVCEIVHIILARCGRFSVIEDTLKDVEYRLSIVRAITSGAIFLHHASLHNHVFVFESGRTFTVNASDRNTSRLQNAAEFSTAGDTIYVIVYNYAPKKIITLFPEKTHTYQN